MNVSQASTDYAAKKNVAKTLIFNVNRFVRLCADKDVTSIVRADLDKFIQVAGDAGLSKDSIWGTIKDMRTVLTDLGIVLEWPTVKRPTPEPDPTPAEDLDGVWSNCDPWLRQHIALTFHCCFRLADILLLQIAGVAVDSKTIRLTASKTKRNHVFPVPDWLRQYLGPVELPFRSAGGWSQVIVRDSLAAACKSAKIPQIYPRNIRQAGITAWSRANGMAGAIAHGSGLRGNVLQHYVAPVQVLESAMPRVTVPAAMRGECQVSAEEELLNSFRRMDAQAQSMVVGVASRLV